jgi:hypothetical protein
MVFAATGEAMAQRPLFITLKEGSNTLLFNSNTELPEIDHVDISYQAPIPNELEAEFASTTGQVAIAKDPDASGGRYLSNIGNGNDNMATFRYDAPIEGKYLLKISYFSAQNRQMFVRVNNGEKINQVFENTGGWNAATAMIKEVEVTLKSGTNVITLGCDSGWAPYVDKIALSFDGFDAVETLLLPQGQHDEAWYSLGGLALHAPMQSGVWIHRNQKYIVKKR